MISPFAAVSNLFKTYQVLKSINAFKNNNWMKSFAAGIDFEADSSSIRQPYQKSIWVYRCINLWTRIATVPILLKDFSQGKEVTTGPIRFLLDSPTTSMTMSQFLKHIFISLGVSGEYFLLKEDGQYSGTGLPKYLTIVWPAHMKLSEGDVDTRINKILRWTRDLGQGNYIKIPVDNVIHDLLPNPYSTVRGLSPIEALRLSVDSDYRAREHNKWMMERHGRISGVVSFDREVGTDQLKVLSDIFREKYEGSENAGKTAFLDNGAKYIQLSTSMKDMDWLEGQKISREEICAAYGIPPNMAGILDKATYSNYEQAAKSLWEDTLIPLGNQITDTLNKRIILPAGGGKIYCEFDYANHVAALQIDIGLRIDRYTKLISQGMMTPEQAAIVCQVDLGEPHPAHKVIWGNISLIPVDDILHPPEPVPEEPKPADKPIAQPPEKSISETIAIENDRLSPVDSKRQFPEIKTNEMSYELRQARGRSIIRQGASYERQLKASLKTFFYQQRKQVMENFEKIVTHIKASTPNGVVTKIKQTPKEISALLLQGKNWNAELKRRAMPALMATGILSAKNFFAEIGMPKDTFRENSLDQFFRSQEILLQTVNDTTAEALVNAAGDMVTALDEGETAIDAADAMRGKIRGIFNAAEGPRRMRIARTEISRSINGARFEEMKEVNIEKHQWLTVHDSAVRESHVEADGEEVVVGHPFSNGCEYPGDPKANEGETINCRCTTIPVFK